MLSSDSWLCSVKVVSSDARGIIGCAWVGWLHASAFTPCYFWLAPHSRILSHLCYPWGACWEPLCHVPLQQALGWVPETHWFNSCIDPPTVSAGGTNRHDLWAGRCPPPPPIAMSVLLFCSMPSPLPRCSSPGLTSLPLWVQVNRVLGYTLHQGAILRPQWLDFMSCTQHWLNTVSMASWWFPIERKGLPEHSRETEAVSSAHVQAQPRQPVAPESLKFCLSPGLDSVRVGKVVCSWPSPGLRAPAALGWDSGLANARDAREAETAISLGSQERAPGLLASLKAPLPGLPCPSFILRPSVQTGVSLGPVGCAGVTLGPCVGRCDCSGLDLFGIWAPSEPGGHTVC